MSIRSAPLDISVPLREEPLRRDEVLMRLQINVQTNAHFPEWHE
jgi:hypothetical protein